MLSISKSHKILVWWRNRSRMKDWALPANFNAVRPVASGCGEDGSVVAELLSIGSAMEDTSSIARRDPRQ